MLVMGPTVVMDLVAALVVAVTHQGNVGCAVCLYRATGPRLNRWLGRLRCHGFPQCWRPVDG